MPQEKVSTTQREKSSFNFEHNVQKTLFEIHFFLNIGSLTFEAHFSEEAHLFGNRQLFKQSP